MRSLTAYLPRPSGRRTGAKSRAARTRHGRVPRRAYPLWRRTPLRVGAGVVVLLSGGLWAWLGGYADAGVSSAENLAKQTLSGLGFTVQKITLAGRAETSTADILKAVQMTRGQSLFDLDSRVAKDRIEALGWVKTAAVSRLWPDTIHIELVERRPFALWQRKHRLVVIDRGGAVITSEKMARFSALPVVVGQGARYAAAQLIDILATEPDLYHRVRAVTRVGERRWNLLFSNGIEIRMPAGGETVAWQRLALLQQNYRILGRDIDAIDLRMPDRLIVRVSKAGAQRMRDPGKET